MPSTVRNAAKTATAHTIVVPAVSGAQSASLVQRMSRDSTRPGEHRVSVLEHEKPGPNMLAELTVSQAPSTRWPSTRQRSAQKPPKQTCSGD